MILQKLENTCSAVHMHSISNFDMLCVFITRKKLLDSIRNNFINNPDLNDESLDLNRNMTVIYICSSTDICRRLKRIGFKTVGYYRGYEDDLVTIMKFHYQKNYKKEYKLSLVQRFYKWISKKP